MSSFRETEENADIKMVFIGILKLMFILLKIAGICFLIMRWWFDRNPIFDKSNSLMNIFTVPDTESDGW